MKPSALSVEEIGGAQTADLSSRGLLSLDAETTQSAKKHLKSATKLGFANILDRSTKDVAFVLRATERGLARSVTMHCKTFWPQPSYRTQAGTPTDPAALFKAGLISSMLTAPLPCPGSGRILAARVCRHHRSHKPCEPPDNSWAVRRHLGPGCAAFEKSRDSAVQYLRHIVDAGIAVAARTTQKQEDDAKRSQQVQPKYSEPYPAKGRGKGSGGSQASSTRPAQVEAARSSYSSYGSYGCSQGYDRGRWYWDYSRNCWAEH